MVNVDKARLEKLNKRFFERFGENPQRTFSSPGRIEICGNHTDHNGGKVLVAAIDCDMVGVVSPADDVVILSEGYSEFAFSLGDIELKKAEIGLAPTMVKGVLKGFCNAGYKIGGFHLVMNSKIFKGAGVSSSAAFELLVAEILNVLYNDNIERMQLAKICQFAENVYFGKPSGLLDQSGIALGGIAKIDFGKSEPKVEKLAFDIRKYQVVIVNTGDHSKLTGEYAKILADMKAVSNFFGKELLCEVDKNKFYKSLPQLKRNVSGRAVMRAVHFFEENIRVEKAAAHLEKGEMRGFLKQIKNSGLSSETYLQNTTHPGDKSQSLKLALCIASEHIKDGASRVHGGGFAGTMIAFINENQADAYANKMGKIFGAKNVIRANIRKEGACEVK